MTQKIADLLLFPIQLRDMGEPMPDVELIFQAKLAAVRILNQAAVGVYELTEENKASLRKINELCQKTGLSLLEGDF